MRCYLLISTFLLVETLSDSSTTPLPIADEFVPIGKDLAATERPLPKSVGSVISSHKVYTEDGIKYTEIVRKTPSGGTQIAHIKGDVKHSLLPVALPVPDLSLVMAKLAKRIEMMRQEPIIETSPTPIHPIVASRPQMITSIQTARSDPIPTATVNLYTPREGPIIYRPYGFESTVPPPYPPFMMYPPVPYGLVGSVRNMAGNILGDVFGFLGKRK